MGPEKKAPKPWLNSLPFYCSLIQTPEFALNVKVAHVPGWSGDKANNKFMTRAWLKDSITGYECMINIQTGLILEHKLFKPSSVNGKDKPLGPAPTVTVKLSREEPPPIWGQVPTQGPWGTVTTIKGTGYGDVIFKVARREVWVPDLANHVKASIAEETDRRVCNGALVHVNHFVFLTDIKQNLCE